MSERVTMQRLEELKQQLELAVHGANVLSRITVCISKEHVKLLVGVIAELQSLRTASVAGVEEAAERIAKRISEYPHPVFAAPAIIRMELTALLAERDAVLRECDDWMLNAEHVLHGAQYHGALKKIDDEHATELRKKYNDELSDRIDAILGKEGDGGILRGITKAVG